ncbi:MAG: helix-hairpin-helix domain-containing protein [Deltaproteobacteria bacterium]|nr:helix-hairpin-helix domain-containing protein [Deltaproteobacteria bacterium]
MKKFIVLLTLILTAAFVSGTVFSPPAMAKEVQKAEAKINVNAATAKELIVLPGIGDKTAANIVSYREEHGPFQAAEDLLKVRGVGKKTLKKIENLISFE